MPKRQGGPTPLSKLQDLEAQRTVPQEGAGHPGCCWASRSPPGAQAGSGTGVRDAAAVEGAAGAATRNGGLPAGHLRPYCERERGPVPGVSWALQLPPAPTRGPRLGQGTASGTFARTQSSLSLHFSKLGREVSVFGFFSKTVPKRRPLFLRHFRRPQFGD